MVHQSVSTFVGKVKSDDSLKQRLQSADLGELLAIAHEHDLHLGEAKALYENAKQSLALWGVGHSDAAAQEAPSGRAGRMERPQRSRIKCKQF